MKHNKLFLAGTALVVTAALVLGACGKNGGGGNAGGGSGGDNAKGLANILSTALSKADADSITALVEALKNATPAMIAGLNANASPGGDFAYDLNAAGDGIVIKSYTGKNPILIVPSEIEGYPVVELAWDGNTSIQVLVLPEGLKKLGGGGYGATDSTYRTYSSLRSVIFPASLAEMEDVAGFSFEDGVFSQCWQLTSADLSHTALTKIPRYAFYSSGLTDLKLPAGIKTIGRWAFRSCDELFTITIPDSVTAITFEDGTSWVGDDYAFEGCGKLPLATRKRLQDLGYPGTFTSD
jgi:hypothetical protein